MKKKIYAASGLIVAAIVASGYWATKATGPSDAEQVVASDATNRADISIRDMAGQAQLIATGRCIETRSEWIQDNRVLVTLATISVDEVIKGDPVSTVTVVLPGGVDANRRIPVAMTYAGAPQIAPQEEVFLFLSSDDSVANGYSVFGFAEGKYSILEDEAGQKVVSRDLVKDGVQKGPGLVRGNRQLVPLAQFKEKVRGYLGQ